MKLGRFLLEGSSRDSGSRPSRITLTHDLCCLVLLIVGTASGSTRKFCGTRKWLDGPKPVFAGRTGLFLCFRVTCRKQGDSVATSLRLSRPQVRSLLRFCSELWLAGRGKYDRLSRLQSPRDGLSNDAGKSFGPAARLRRADEMIAFPEGYNLHSERVCPTQWFIMRLMVQQRLRLQ